MLSKESVSPSAVVTLKALSYRLPQVSQVWVLMGVEYPDAPRFRRSRYADVPLTRRRHTCAAEWRRQPDGPHTLMTDFNYAQRRRLALAAAITAIAVPLVFVLGDGDGNEAETAPTVTVVGAPQPPGEGAGAAPSGDVDSAPDGTDAMGTPPVAFLEEAPAVQQDPATIAVPRVGQSVSGTASFRRNLRSRTLCQAKNVPFNSTIQVTNLDNGRTVRCINSVGGTEPVADVVLHADAFLLIADLTDAPVPVEITW